MILKHLYDQKLLKSAPPWIVHNTHYLTISGSIAYGCANTGKDEASDFDTIGICVAPKEDTFPQYVLGFDPPPKLQPGNGSGVYEEHHVFDPNALGGKGRNYDINVYNITKFFQECAKCNPNLIDSLFTRHECVLHCTKVGHIILENRKTFLSKKCFNTYKEYASSQLHKMKSKTPIGKRKEQREQYGFDVKFGYNLVRLLEECDQILSEGDLDLMRCREQLKAIRRGEWTQIQVEEYCFAKQKHLEAIYSQSKLPYHPDENKIRTVLLQCLEHHYGSMDKFLPKDPDMSEKLLKQIKCLIADSGL